MVTRFRSSIAITAALILLAVNTAKADPIDAASSYLQVHVPETLSRSDGYDHRVALFGMLSHDYGDDASITQSVYYADSDLCDPIVDNRKGFPTRAKDSKGKMEPWPTPYILMVDRGGCSFDQKVRNAQRAGAAGVLIADNTCLCSDHDCISANTEDVCQPTEPSMHDDGSGGDISIPSFLMLKMDADEIKAELRANNLVQVEMQWANPSHNNEHTEYVLWTNPSDPGSKDFQKKFKPAAQALGDFAYFTPHMYIYDGIKMNCQDYAGNNICYSLCTNNGRYCFSGPDTKLDSGVTGADVVKESLRRICVWKHYGESDRVGSEWWDYVAQFIEHCDYPDLFTDEDCLKNCFNKANIDGDLIENCMSDSGGLEANAPNALLDIEIEMQAKVNRGIGTQSALFINDVFDKGEFSVNAVFTAVCNGHLGRTEPEICKECNDGCDGFNQCIAEKKCKNKHESKTPDNDISIRDQTSMSSHDVEECDAVNCDIVNGEAFDCNITRTEHPNLTDLSEEEIKAREREQLHKIICACCTESAKEDEQSRRNAMTDVIDLTSASPKISARTNMSLKRLTMKSETSLLCLVMMWKSVI